MSVLRFFLALRCGAALLFSHPTGVHDLQLKPGDIIQSSKWPEPIEIKSVEPFGAYFKIIAATVSSRHFIEDMVTASDLADAKTFAIESRFSAAPMSVFLALEAKRYRYANLYDPLLAVNTSKVDPLPHQVEAVYGYVLKLPRIRFLIADDPGAGKTIMAGLIIKELKLRRLAERILIIVPGHLKDQWRREMLDRFKEPFVEINREYISSNYGINPFEKDNSLIASKDFCKQDDILPLLSATDFDLIICDEAHKMAAYKYGDKVNKTKSYRLGEALSRNATHLLFLTATPHKGDPENFRLFLDLLEPGFFANSDMMNESIANRENPLFVRRLKEDLKDFDGKPLFLKRHVKTLAFDLGSTSPDEKDLYNNLSKYVSEQYNKALSGLKKKNVAFALVILQRRFASSVYAVFRSLERRRKRLTELLANFHNSSAKKINSMDYEDILDDDEDEATRWENEEEWEALSVAENREELRKEISVIEQLIADSRSIIDTHSEAKLSELRKTLTELGQSNPGKKILIFTESRDTLDYLESRIKHWGYSVNTIHGGMPLDVRINQERRFKNETQILVATEAAGEGINLQFCNLMINYDIPWNPNRLEQRMGRIHRYGQTKEVYIFNLVAEDTREGKVLKRLFEKIEEIRNALGSDKVFDVLNEVLYGVNLSQLLVDAAAKARGLDDIIGEINITVDNEYIAKVKDNLGDSLATHFIDYTKIKELSQRAKESRLLPEYTQAFFSQAFEHHSGKLKKRKDGFFAIESVPTPIRHTAADINFKTSHGSLFSKYPKVTFSKDVAFKHPDSDFMCFGHPLFEAVLANVEQHLMSSALDGAVFYDPDGRLNGPVLFYEAEVKDGAGHIAGKRLFSLHFDEDTKICRPFNPSQLWDLAREDPTGQSLPLPDIDIMAMKKIAISELMPALENYKAELLTERLRQTGIKERYGVASLRILIGKLDEDLIELNSRLERGDSVQLAIHNKETRLNSYHLAITDLKRAIEQDKSLTLAAPVFTGMIYVRPLLAPGLPMENNPDIELIGMELTMNVERQAGRIPEDVSPQNLGYDVRSVDSDGAYRYIEVKARSGQGSVALTQNEWFKAQRFGDDYYLYAVYDAATNPRLVSVRNPAVNLIPETILESVRHVLDFEQVFQRGNKLEYLKPPAWQP